MEFNTARLTLFIDPNKKEVFGRLCAPQDRKRAPSSELRTPRPPES
jgi:hypothetical protein